MNTTILERYSCTPEGRYIIDITAGKINDLYNAFDKLTPYARKELDPELVEYLRDSARELGKEDFIIRFDLLEPPDEQMRTRISDSIRNYFLYMKSSELNELARSMRISSIYMVTGLALLFLSVWVNQQLSPEATVLSKVFAEGLTVAAWVSLWEALATFLVNWAPYTRQAKLYERIAHAPLEFSAVSPTCSVE